MNERFIFYYDKTVKLVKEIIDDDELSSEEKVRLLGVILQKVLNTSSYKYVYSGSIENEEKDQFQE